MRPLLAVIACAFVLSADCKALADGGLPPTARGINLGNYLESPHEGDWNGGRVLTEEDFTNIKNAGFSFVRVPISWAAHVTTTPGVPIDPTFLARVDWVVAQAGKNHLRAILDYHNDDALMKDPADNVSRFLATWKAVAEHYKDAPPSILFELLNEPHGKLDTLHWNALVPLALAEVRASNPTRTVVIGTSPWGGIYGLSGLEVPDGDAHLLVTFHFYDPMTFTHQGASWVPGSDKNLGTSWDGTDAEKKAITDSFDKAAQWAVAHHRMLYLGEFGAYSKGDLDSRARWTAFVARTAEAHGWPWSYWEYSAGFGAYDPATQQWREPLLRALIPK